MTKHATVVRLLRQDAASGMCRGHLSTAADAIEALEREVEGLRAARMAYASEFPPNGDGEPDVGSIHQNIRALKVQVEGLRKKAARYDYLTMGHGDLCITHVADAMSILKAGAADGLIDDAIQHEGASNAGT